MSVIHPRQHPFSPELNVLVGENKEKTPKLTIKHNKELELVLKIASPYENQKFLLLCSHVFPQ